MPTMAPPEDALTERFARLDERFDRVDERFDEVNRRIADGREESKQRFDRVEGEVRDLRQGMERLHSIIQRGNFVLIATLVGVILTGLFKGG